MPQAKAEAGAPGQEKLSLPDNVRLKVDCSSLLGIQDSELHPPAPRHVNPTYARLGMSLTERRR